MNLARTARRAALSVLLSIGTMCTIASMALGVQSCAWFDKHVEPVVKPIATCAGQSVSAADFQEAVNDLTNKDYGDLAQMGVRLGWDVLACVIDNIGQQNPALKVNGDEFKAQHAKQIEEAQRPSTALRSPGDPTPTTGPSWPADQDAKYFYAGETVMAAAARCDQACAPNEGIGSPGQNCLCRHVDKKNWRNTRWVSIADPPPGFGPGVAAGGGSGR